METMAADILNGRTKTTHNSSSRQDHFVDVLIQDQAYDVLSRKKAQTKVVHSGLVLKKGVLVAAFLNGVIRSSYSLTLPII